ncbi:hypothetical protein LZ32DRAFT_283502 [Colletotrichum eremochloae]|nr:hypothetical protein LZ32DRAFT_283502 [Colletotrichum eremochloae]
MCRTIQLTIGGGAGEQEGEEGQEETAQLGEEGECAARAAQVRPDDRASQEVTMEIFPCLHGRYSGTYSSSFFGTFLLLIIMIGPTIASFRSGRTFHT